MPLWVAERKLDRRSGQRHFILLANGVNSLHTSDNLGGRGLIVVLCPGVAPVARIPEFKRAAEQQPTITPKLSRRVRGPALKTSHPVGGHGHLLLRGYDRTRCFAQLRQNVLDAVGNEQIDALRRRRH